MSRSSLKTLSITPVEFIPLFHKEDADLSKDAKEIENRPLIFIVRKLTREDRFNIRGLAEVASKDEIDRVTNMGSIFRYIFEHCVLEVKNVLLEAEKLESVKGDKKNSLFNTEGIDLEIAECIAFIQEISSLTETEAKN